MPRRGGRADICFLLLGREIALCDQAWWSAAISVARLHRNFQGSSNGPTLGRVRGRWASPSPVGAACELPFPVIAGPFEASSRHPPGNRRLLRALIYGLSLINPLTESSSSLRDVIRQRNRLKMDHVHSVARLVDVIDDVVVCNPFNVLVWRSLHGFVPVTPEAEAPRCAKAASRCFSLRCDRHKVLTWEWMGASCYLRLGAALKRPV
ncbi:unnamed protein product [Pleuronectes platessa]|uniref:Uncharacterized protein n=1 Tax=Pleuronectes platessa TaxID=8262 RepID=A0A9N7YWB0_PLEPL|nr:unnamed protein product [Pleuronectes platessa]